MLTTIAPEPLSRPIDDDASRACAAALAAYLGIDPESGVDPFQSLALAPDAVVVVDATKRVLYCNELAAALTGGAPTDVIGRSCVDGLRFATCGEHCAMFDEDVVANRHCELVPRGGGRVHVIKNARAFRDADGRLVGGIESMQDVTELRQAEERLAAQAARLSLEYGLLEGFVRSVEEPVLAVDRKGAILCLSDRAGELLGIADARGRHVLDFVVDDGSVSGALHSVLTRGGRRELADVALRRRVRAGVRTSLRLSAVASSAGQVLGATVVLLNSSVADAPAFYDMVGRSSAMQRLRAAIESLAKSDATVLITGASGVGKEMVARALHLAGPRQDRPFHAVNCAALTEPLLESELFGHERGAFTGADHAKPGRLELCGDGTLLWDEVGCLPLRLQAKLLRVLEQREFERVGGTRTLHLRARILAATNSDLGDLVRRGAFREDLYYRLRVVPVDVPPLRDRRDDISDLAQHFVRVLAGSHEDATLLTPSALAALLAYGWPGNVRELKNAIQFAVALGAGRGAVGVTDLPVEIQRAVPDLSDDEDEKRRIVRALEETRYNRARTAERLRVSRTTLWRKMRRYGLE